MSVIRVRQVVAENGKLVITDLPYEKGQAIEITLQPQSTGAASRSRLTVQQFRQSGLIGLWKDRGDIRDSAAYARMLREQAQKRGDISYDPAG